MWPSTYPYRRKIRKKGGPEKLRFIARRVKSWPLQQRNVTNTDLMCYFFIDFAPLPDVNQSWLTDWIKCNILRNYDQAKLQPFFMFERSTNGFAFWRKKRAANCLLGGATWPLSCFREKSDFEGTHSNINLPPGSNYEYLFSEVWGQNSVRSFVEQNFSRI